jgi:hypothetical protein
MWRGAFSARLTVALAAAVLIVLSAPFIGQIRGAIQAALPSSYRTIVAGVVAAGLLIAIAAALLKIREQRLTRYSTLAAAVTIGSLYAAATATGIPEVDAVERFHFLEYGVLTVLFYRVWADRADVSSLAMPLTAGFVTGTADEAMQWFVPLRVGELHDILLNGVAIACGLLFAIAITPPRRLSWSVDRSSARRLAHAATAAFLPCALFFDAVHIGHEVRDPEVGIFRSNSEAPTLLAESADRAARWRMEPPVTVSRLSREDQYLNEATWHVQERNVAWAANDYARAWRENLIVEKFFAPILDYPTYATPNGARWPAAQREAAAAADSLPRTFVSEANPYPVYVWNRAVFWGAVVAVLSGIWFVCLNLRVNVSTSSTAHSIT